ncbi:hypothetical protein D6825_01630 [Candidatus Woesearchaeota archaeon]|nr:MAG: hypothetical protein D6825_01630 [Candidatus Woesearchaeota archaeon]
MLKPKGKLVILDQFKEGNPLILTLIQPIKLLLGWGKEYDIQELTQNTPFKIKKKKRFGKMEGTQLCVMEKNTT